MSERVPLDALERLEIQIDATRGQYADFIRRHDPQDGLTAVLRPTKEPDA